MFDDWMADAEQVIVKIREAELLGHYKIADDMVQKLRDDILDRISTGKLTVKESAQLAIQALKAENYKRTACD